MTPTDPASYEELPADVEERANAILLGPSVDVAAGFASLCASHEHLRGPLERLRSDFLRAARLLDGQAPPVHDGLPAPMGPYRFLRKIGEGAFGVVFLAEQQQPIRRQVAIKLLHGGAWSPTAAARFLNERETLARMNHPAIARIFDAGVDAHGRPHFVMEYVPGEPLHAWVARRSPSLRSRIELFLAACEGVSHAHQRGVIHRDLKPHNILVGDVDGRAVPKVIDFGLAKVLAQDAGAVHTRAGAVLGTPAYMSPEQLRGDAHDVDTRADVYSLGVILYEILTGSLPLGPEHYRSASLGDLQRMLDTGEPPLASVRAAGANAELASRLRGDLDWILRKAMARRRDERYASVEELAADLRRHLAHEPVVAKPPTASYIVRKFVRRHRIPVAAGAVVLVTLLACLGVGTELYLQARASASAANHSLGDFWRLADLIELDALLAEEKELWPASPERSPEHERWLARARGLLERRGLHAATVRDLEAEAARGAASVEAERGARFLRKSLDKLLAGLDELAKDRGALGSVERRAEFARTVRARSIEEPRTAWERAIAAVAASPRYGGKRLAPIVGLVPLGPDPKSGLEELAHLQSGRVPCRGPDGRLEIADDTAIVLVLMPGGNARLGSQSADPAQPHYDPHRTPIEARVARARIEPFLIGKHELTQGQVKALGLCSQSTGRAGMKTESRGVTTDRHPEETVLAPVVEAWLPHFGLRLPTTSEWELAARGGSPSIWGCGDEVASLQGHANVADATVAEDKDIVRPGDARVRDGFLGHAPVGTFAPNGYGLHDVIGNVAEITVGSVRLKEGNAYLARGGSFMLRPTESRIGSLRVLMANQTTPEIGVRVARSLP